METFVSRIIEEGIIRLLSFLSELWGLLYLQYDRFSVPMGWLKYIPFQFVKITVQRVGSHSTQMVNLYFHTFQHKICKHYVQRARKFGIHFKGNF